MGQRGAGGRVRRRPVRRLGSVHAHGGSWLGRRAGAGAGARRGGLPSGRGRVGVDAGATRVAAADYSAPRILVSVSQPGSCHTYTRRARAHTQREGGRERERESERESERERDSERERETEGGRTIQGSCYTKISVHGPQPSQRGPRASCNNAGRSCGAWCWTASRLLCAAHRPVTSGCHREFAGTSRPPRLKESNTRLLVKESNTPLAIATAAERSAAPGTEAMKAAARRTARASPVQTA